MTTETNVTGVYGQVQRALDAMQSQGYDITIEWGPDSELIVCATTAVTARFALLLATSIADAGRHGWQGTEPDLSDVLSAHGYVTEGMHHVGARRYCLPAVCGVL